MAVSKIAVRELSSLFKGTRFTLCNTSDFETALNDRPIVNTHSILTVYI